MKETDQSSKQKFNLKNTEEISLKTEQKICQKMKRKERGPVQKVQYLKNGKSKKRKQRK